MSINNRDKFPWDMWLFQILGWFWHKDGYINKQSNENKHKFAIGIVLIQGSRCYSEDLNTRSFLWTPTSFNTFNTTYKLLHPITPSLYIISDTSFLHTDQLQYHYYTATPYSFLVSLLHTDQLQYTYYTPHSFFEYHFCTTTNFYNPLHLSISFLWTPTNFNTFNTTYKLLHPITPSL